MYGTRRKPDGKQWLFAPSKFVGYSDNSAEAYFSEQNERDGRQTERVLQQWFHTVEPGTHRADASGKGTAGLPEQVRPLSAAQGRQNLHPYGNPRSPGPMPRRRRPGSPSIPAICAGRPHIRGTRVRVSDILELLASGASAAEILDDYPYLEEADLNAALAYGATAIDHRIVIAA